MTCWLLIWKSVLKQGLLLKLDIKIMILMYKFKVLSSILVHKLSWLSNIDERINVIAGANDEIEI